MAEENTTFDDEIIFRNAQRFRSAIEVTDFHEICVQMLKFPSECCDIACRLLGLWFFDCGCRGFEIVAGDHPKMATDSGGSHAWLKRDGLIVDITADQFGQPPVIVTRASEFHDRLQGKSWSCEFDSDYWSRVRNWEVYSEMYPRIVARMTLS